MMHVNKLVKISLNTKVWYLPLDHLGIVYDGTYIEKPGLRFTLKPLLYVEGSFLYLITSENSSSSRIDDKEKEYRSL